MRPVPAPASSGALCLAAVSVVLAALALAPAYGLSSTLVLDPIPDWAYAGDKIVFTGTLTGGGYALPDRVVWICEDDPFVPDECLAYGMTNRFGEYRIWWTAEAGVVEVDFDIYAEFEGDSAYDSAQTPRQTMSIFEHDTHIVLDPLPARVYAGDVVPFGGTLVDGDGYPLAGKTVRVCEDDPFVPDECLAWAMTDERGRYYVEWVARAGIVEIDFDIYAEFGGDGRHDGDQTPRYTMSVHKYGGSIRLDPIPDRAAYGDVISLSGTLSLDAHSPEGSVVYIKDEDTLNPDDLLTTAYVDASGRFATSWIVADVDPDYNIDIQAVYEGGPLYYRMATTIQKLYGYEGVADPGPGSGPSPGDGYMKLYRSLDFDRAPRVAIVPSPDSYNEVRGHIVPVQEGIRGLTAMLEGAYPAGDWNVDFEVVTPGNVFDARPDVIVNLVTRDDDSDCDWDWYGGGTLGWASTIDPKPVPTTVCSLDDLTNAEIGVTAVHEFVHAIGLGHTFNIPGDLMCSVEDGKPTCPGGTGYKSTTFSDLNLAALVAIYGTDGFQNPNNHITRNEKFTLNGYQGGGTAVSQPGGGAADEHLPTVIFTDLDQYKEGEVILVDGIYTGEHEEYLTLHLADQYNDVVDTVPVSRGPIIGEFFFGFHPAGTYTVWLYDEYDWVGGNSFEISGVDDAVIYADETWYSFGDPIYLDGFYWGSYDGWSELLVLDSFGDVAEQADVWVVDDFFGVYVGGYYTPGRYLVLLYDGSGELAASTAFHVSSGP